MPREKADFDPFPGEIAIWLNHEQNHRPAERYAAAACAPASQRRSRLFRNTYVAFTDGSAGRRADDPSGKNKWCSAGAAWRLYPRQHWQTRGWPLFECGKSHLAEMMAIEKKLRAAVDTIDTLLADLPAAAAAAPAQSFVAALVRARAAAAAGVALSPPDAARFLLFSDCEGVLRALKTLRRGCLLPLSYPPSLLENICALAARLEVRGVRVELRWVPSHRGITGNELADAVAKDNRPDVLDPAGYPAPVSKSQKRNRRRMNLLVVGGPTGGAGDEGN
ncbi:hypothetical protein SLS55_009575 [Diplodia seriata]|uniref:RNase H type-1 domain-containing protein n=1 Tax=Diplodia seriata TaxID=420778 RepID=A0ABR3C349_9PEZI